MKSTSSSGPQAPQPLAEAQCIQRCKAGDHGAFGMLVMIYQDRVFNLCYRMCGSRADAEDLTQEAFMKALKSIASFDGRAGFYTWLYRIAVNLTLSNRRQFPRRAASLDVVNEDGQSRAAELPARDSRPGRAMEEREDAQMIEQALAALEDQHRAVIILRDMESLDYNQIADVLDIPAGTVKSRLHRARCALRELLSPMFEKGRSAP
jgi:RNA polymerase sigma-70 factor (ECF subfamily)